MTLHRLLVCLSIAGAIAGAATPLAAQSALVLVPRRMADVTSPADLERAGLAHLTREHRLALDGGLTAPPGAPVVATPDDGSYVRLADGTMWEVHLPDRPTVDAWRRGDYVVVSRAAAGAGEFDHLLVNASARTRAFARFAGFVAQRRR